MPNTLVEDMRVAWQKMPARTAGEIQAEEWLKSDPKGFRTYFAALEKQAGGEVPEEAEPTENVVAEPDEGTKAARELIGELLAGL